MDIERERGITIKLNTARMNVEEDGKATPLFGSQGVTSEA